jgi:hypothetical protein
MEVARVEAACARLATADRAAAEAELMAFRATPLHGGGAAVVQAVLTHSRSAEAMFHAAGAVPSSPRIPSLAITLREGGEVGAVFFQPVAILGFRRTLPPRRC